MLCVPAPKMGAACTRCLWGEEVTAEDGAAVQENSASLLRPSIRITSEAQGHSPHASKMTIFSNICSVDPDSTQVPF